MDGVRRHIAAFAGTIRFRLTLHAQRHFAMQDNVRDFCWVRMVRVACVRPIFPCIHTRKSRAVELGRKLAFLHKRILERVGRDPELRAIPSKTSRKHDYALSAAMGVAAERARRLQERRSLNAVSIRPVVVALPLEPGRVCT